LSTTVDLREFLGAYLAEAEEHLALANARLLDIDASVRQGGANPRAVRDLLRALHTVKGLSSMVGVEPVVAIAHRMESALRSADSGGGSLSAEAVDTLLKGVQAIENRVRALAERRTVTSPPPALLEAIDQIEPGIAATVVDTRALDLDPALASKLAPFELAALACNGKDGRRAMRGDFTPSPATVAEGLSISVVRERVGAIAEIVKILPVSVPTSVGAPSGLSFALLVVTSASDAALAAAIGIEPAALRAIAVVADSAALGESLVPTDGLEVPEEPAQQRHGIVRVDVQRLDDAMEQLSALIVTRSRLARAVAAMAEAGVNTRELAQIVKDNSRQLRDLRAAILRVRMVPVRELLERVPLILRGIGRERGAHARLLVETGEAELDKAVAERIFPAIAHIIRNAVDHAIEASGERVRAGKPAEGTLRITCSARSNTRLELSISDDGRGIDREAVARRVGHEIGATDADLLDALCLAGLSTRDEATTTSGRGMGMDIVRRVVVDQLGGELLMTTERGVGTTFTLRVPLTIAIVDAFTLECAGQRFVVPVSMVDEIIEIDPGMVRHGPSRPGKASPRYAGLVERRGETIPLVDLASVFRLNVAPGGPRQALLVRRAAAVMAFGIDRVQGQQEAVVRPLTDPLVHVPGIAGASDLGDGRPTLVLDLVALGASLLTADDGTPSGRRSQRRKELVA